MNQQQREKAEGLTESASSVQSRPCMRKTTSLALAATLMLLGGAPGSANAADVEVWTPPAGNFVIKDSTGAALRFGVNGTTGDVTIPSLPGSVAQAGWLCYNAASGLLGKCTTIPAGPPGPPGLLPNGTAPGNTPYWDGANWVVSSRNIWNDPGSQLVGIGTAAAPTYKLDVEHGGSTGIRSRSTGSFSVVDIDGASGDAALRFQNAGVGQWNTRNRPADNYYEIFELGGGGSRFVIQDATGYVGIGGPGATASPAYPLDLEHGGSTGFRSKSTSSFSVVDIDAASGDAALRFQKAGVGQWNTRNRPADNYYEIFELGGGGSRFVIQDGTGYVGIGGPGATASPAYPLDVEHGGSTGIRSRSTSSFSVVDIDAASGDAALRFQRAGVNQWNIRNNPATDDLQFFELGGGGERMRIENSTGRVVISGDLQVNGGTKNFVMDHPLDPENQLLMHAALESNEVLNVYSGNVVSDASGKAVVRLPDYFEALNKDFRYQLTVVGGGFAQAIVSREVSGNQFEIATSQPSVKVSWEVKGVRNDAHMQKFPFVAQRAKTATEKTRSNQAVAAGSAQPKIGNVATSSIDSQPPLTQPTSNPLNTSGGSLDNPVIPAQVPNPLNTTGGSVK